MKTSKQQIKFKNPFDLMEQEQEAMAPTPPVYKAEGKVHQPLPFNPYDIQPTQTKKVNMVEQPAQPPKIIKAPVPTPAPSNTTAFSHPFQNSAQQQPAAAPKQYKQSELDENGDPPLLEDLGIQPQKIKERIFLILKLGTPSFQTIQDPDLSGPILIALTFGCLLLFSGKIHFGDIYAMFIFGNLLIFSLFNCMSQIQIIPLYNIMSLVGYGLLPMLFLGFFGIFAQLNSSVGIIFALVIALWSSIAAGNFVQVMMRNHSDRKILLIYPLFLFYISFSMIVIF